jgi:hypothetical protein
MGWACGTHGRDEKCIQILIGKSEGKRPLGRPKRRWEDNIRMDVGNRVGRYGLDSSGSREGPVAGNLTK